MSAHAGVRQETHLEQLLRELEAEGEVYVPALDGETTYRIAVCEDDDTPVALSWFVESGPRKPVLWGNPVRFQHESRTRWAERVARGFIFAVMSGVDLRIDD